MARSSLGERYPAFLLGKHQLVLTVTFTAFFSLVFLLVCIPFSHNAWFQLGGGTAFMFTLVFYLIAVSVVISSKMGLYMLRASGLSTGHVVLWNMAEVLLIALIYSFFTIEGSRFGIIDLEDMAFGSLFLSAVVYSLISLGVPYALVTQYLLIEEKDKTIRLMDYKSVVVDTPVTPGGEQRITLFDNGGALKFSISPDNLYLIESDDNYIQVWYTDSGGNMKKYMLRCRLKTVEESFADSDLVRCHRKYIINIRKVRILTSSKYGYGIDLGRDVIPRIPVSKTYAQAVLARFNSRT